METLLAVLQAASALAPVIQSVFSALDSNSKGLPLSASTVAAVMAELQAAEAIVPALSPVLPIVQKQFDGIEITDSDLDILQTAATALDVEVAAKADLVMKGPPS